MIELDLPYPPSVNRIWRSFRAGSTVTLSPQYRAWLDAADRLCMANATCRGGRRISGPFEAHVVVARDGRRMHIDLDNGAKAVLDYAKRAQLIDDDRFLQRLTIQWGDPVDAPEGCRLTLSAWRAMTDMRGAERPFVAAGQRL